MIMPCTSNPTQHYYLRIKLFQKPYAPTRVSRNPHLGKCFANASASEEKPIMKRRKTSLSSRDTYQNLINLLIRSLVITSIDSKFGAYFSIGNPSS